MFTKKFLLLMVWVLLAALSGCSEKKENTGTSTATGTKTAAPQPVKEEAPLPRTLCAGNYSDNTQWRNGIDTKEKNRFFCSIKKTDPTPVMPGHILEFAKSGKAVILGVYRDEKPNGDTVFITVAKNLDSTGDGYPNPIHIKSFQIQTSPYSQENEWKNGISLKKPSMFFFMIDKKASIPFKAGNRLKLVTTGETLITEIYRHEAQEKLSQIFVTVNKPIDPVGDGNPHFIEILINEDVN